ncbi:hypothetical protein [Pedobacter sp. AJM]|nr:hypothetical protein [Pedobacter sp. AJM]
MKKREQLDPISATNKDMAINLFNIQRQRYGIQISKMKQNL